MNKDLEVPKCVRHNKPVLFLPDGMWACKEGKHRSKYPEASNLFKLTFHSGLLLLYPFYIKGMDRAEVILLMKELEKRLKDTKSAQNLPGLAYLISRIHKWALDGSYQFDKHTSKALEKSGWDPDEIEIEDNVLKEIVVCALDFIKYAGLMHVLEDKNLLNIEQKVNNAINYIERIRDCDVYFFPDRVYDSGFYEDFLDKSLKIINAIDNSKEFKAVVEHLKKTLIEKKLKKILS